MGVGKGAVGRIAGLGLSRGGLGAVPSGMCRCTGLRGLSLDCGEVRMVPRRVLGLGGLQALSLTFGGLGMLRNTLFGLPGLGVLGLRNGRVGRLPGRVLSSGVAALVLDGGGVRRLSRDLVDNVAGLSVMSGPISCISRLMVRSSGGIMVPSVRLLGGRARGGGVVVRGSGGGVFVDCSRTSRVFRGELVARLDILGGCVKNFRR